KHWAVTEIGCGTDTAEKQVAVTNVPVAGFTVNGPVCAGAPLSFANLTAFTGHGAIASYSWAFGDQQQATTTGNQPIDHTYRQYGNYTVTLQVQTSSGCKSNLLEKQITVHPVPVAAFEAPQT